MRRFKAHISVRRAIGFVLMGIVGIFVFGSLVMLLWNALLPELFHLPAIHFWQALGLLILAKIFFGGFRGGPGGRWKHMKEQNWADMTPEEKEKIRQEWGRRCGRGFAGGTAASTSAPDSTAKQDT